MLACDGQGRDGVLRFIVEVHVPCRANWSRPKFAAAPREPIRSRHRELLLITAIQATAGLLSRVQTEGRLGLSGKKCTSSRRRTSWGCHTRQKPCLRVAPA